MILTIPTWSHMFNGFIRSVLNAHNHLNGSKIILRKVDKLIMHEERRGAMGSVSDS